MIRFFNKSIIFLFVLMFFICCPFLPDKEFFVRQVYAEQTTIDDTIHITTTNHNGPSPTTVFIDQNTGYAFYSDSTGNIAYRKTTNGGVTWGSTVVVDANTDNFAVAVWYDRWTPNDTGNLIHIAFIDSGDDDIWYRTLDTASDTLSGTGAVNITSGLSYTGTLASGTNVVTIAKATDGALYAAVTDGTDNIMARCTSSCTTVTNWVVSEPASWTAGNDFQILIPRLSGEMMLIWWDISATSNDLKYSRYTGSWSSFANIDTALDNTTYDASFGATVNSSNGDVYLAYAGDAATLGTDDDVRVRRFSGSSWSTLTDVVTNSVCAGTSNCGITGVKTAYDSNSGILYVLYTARSTAGTASTGNIYWKYSTNGGSSWSSEFGPVYSTDDDIYGARLSLMTSSSQRIYATWYAATPDDLFGRPIAPKTYEQSAYRFFANTNSTDVGATYAAQDTAITLSTTGQTFRLRLLLHTGISDLFTNEGSFKLQYAQMSGTCDTGFSGESYADITGSTPIAYYDNATPSDGAALTANADDPTHSGHTIVNQTYEESNNFSNSQGVVNEGQDGKWDFSLFDNGASANTAYCLRAVRADNSLLDTYGVIPQVTTAEAAVISVTVSDGNVAYGLMSLGSSKSTLPSELNDKQTATNESNVTVNLNIRGYDATGGGCTWTLASSNGSNQYVHRFCNQTSLNCSNPPTNYTPLTTSYQTLATGVSQSGTVDFQLRITVPTTSSCYGQQSVNVTVQAVQP